MATVKVLVGTKKGAFIYTSDEKRESWQVSKPIFTGWTVLHMAGDARGPQPRLYAAATHWAWGPSVSRSTDGGETWTEVAGGGFPDTELGRIAIAISSSNPNVMYTMVEAAATEEGGERLSGLDGGERPL